MKYKFIASKQGDVMVDNYPKAYREVNEILKYVSKDDVKKIPEDVLETIQKNMDSGYDFLVDESKTFEEQNLLIETKAILANIFYDYWATDYQKEKIKEIRKQEEIAIEEEKKKKFDNTDIFANKKIDVQESIVSENLPIVVEKNIFEKIIGFIKNLFKKG